MNTTTETRVPSPEIAQQSPAPQLPDVATDSKGQPIVVHGHTATKEFGQVIGAIAAVMADLQPVEKGGENTFHHYKYARMQDILQMLTPLMGKHGIVVFQYEDARNMFDDNNVIAITYRFIVAHKSGQTWVDPVPQTGMSPCRTSKGTFDDKAFAKCHTSARKYFLLSLFQVPTEDENDPDNEKAQRKAGPVPSPDGHVAPHLIEPNNRDTFDSWANRYLAGARTAKSLAELDQWDQLNDGPLTQMDASETGKAVYERLLKELETIRARLTPASVTTASPTSPEFYEKAAQAIDKQDAPAAAVKRPEGCPDADKDPDGFVEWATKRLRTVAGRKNAEELTLVFEQEVMELADGLFKPDVDSLKSLFDELLGKIGG